MNAILADGRWTGQNGISRFSYEVLARLSNTDILLEGPRPLSLTNLVWQATLLSRKTFPYKAFFTPGFNPVLFSKVPFVLSIADLIHLYAPPQKLTSKIFYQTLIKPAVSKAFKVITVSEYSKKTIMEWANLPAEKIINVSCGISTTLTAQGSLHQPGYPYCLHVGNTKPHKNIPRLLQAFALSTIDKGIKLILTGDNTPDIQRLINQYQLQDRIVFVTHLTESGLAAYYRGALAVLFPSLYEGFGLPVVEAMAVGTPVLTSHSTSLLEVAADAALLVDPHDVDEIKCGIEKIVHDTALRQDCVSKGLARAKDFSWENTAAKVQQVLDEMINR